MTNVMDKIEEKLMPIASFFGNEKHFLAIRDGIVSAVPFTIIGSFFLVLASPPFDETISTGFAFLDNFFLGWLHWAQANSEFILAPFNVCMGIMSLYICIAIAYSLSRSYQKQALNYVLSTVCVYLLLITPIKDGNIVTAPLQSKGILLSALISILVVETMRKIEDKGWTIRLPESVPTAVSASFSSLIPLTITLAVFYSISILCQITTGVTIPDLFFNMFENVKASVDNPTMITLLIGIESFMFGFGVHPSTVVGPIVNPIALMNTTENASLVAQGLKASHIYTDPFFNFYIGIGGAGATLVLCMMLLKSRSKQMREIGKVAIIPSLFNINEPLIFGLPIFLNPILIIPFTIAPMVNTLIGWTMTSLGIVSAAYINAPWTLPAPFGALLSTLDIKAFLMVLFMFVIDGLIYYPFMKIYEKTLVDEESKKEDVCE